jgi:AhpD family alkylhydroperoxidase
MQARMKNPLLLFPDALNGLLAVHKAAADEGLPDITRSLVHLRASQINGCGVCIEMHARELKQAGEKDERIFAVAAWRDTDFFTDAERAALALTESATRLSDRAEAVSDAVWDEAAAQYSERALAALVLQIALINTFNRVNASTRQIASADMEKRSNGPRPRVSADGAGKEEPAHH